MTLTPPRLSFTGYSTTPVPLTAGLSESHKHTFDAIHYLTPLGVSPGQGGTNAEFERELEYTLLDLHADDASPLLHRLDHGDADTSPVAETKWVVSIPGATLTVRRDFEHLHFEYIPAEITRRVVREYSVYEDVDDESEAVAEVEYCVPESAIATTFETAYSRIELYNVLRAFLHHTTYMWGVKDDATSHLEYNDTDLGMHWLFRRALRAIHVGDYSHSPGEIFWGFTADTSQHGDNPAVKVHWQTWTMKPAVSVNLKLVLYAELGGDQ